jgi:hypothetical protein
MLLLCHIKWEYFINSLPSYEITSKDVKKILICCDVLNIT